MSTPIVAPPHRLAEAANRHVEQTGQQGQLPVANVGYACPRCPSGSGSYVLAASGAFRCSKVDSHRWADNDELMNENPTKIAVPRRAPQPMQGGVEIRVTIPGQLRDALQLKFGERLGPTLTAILPMLITPGAFIVGEIERAKFLQVAGKEFKDGSDIAGHIFSLNDIINNLRDQVGRLQQDAARRAGVAGAGTPAPNSNAPASISMLNLAEVLPESTLGKLRQKALMQETTMAAVATNALTMALDNDWV